MARKKKKVIVKATQKSYTFYRNDRKVVIKASTQSEAIEKFTKLTK